MSTLIRSAMIGALAAVAACSASDRSPTDPPPPNGSSADGRISVQINPSMLFPQSYRWLAINAVDGTGRRVSTASARISTSNSSVAEIAAVDTFPDVDTQTGRKWDVLYARIYFVAPGTATLRATFGSLAQDVALTVQPLPPRSTALAVDSFTVIEQAGCSSGCLVAYEPILRLRAANGGAPVEVVAMEINVPGATTGFCTGSMTYAPGESADLIYYEDDLGGEWGSPMEFQGPGGLAVPDGPATARVIVRDASGALGLVEATGSIQRMVQAPVLPLTGDESLLAWACS